MTARPACRRLTAAALLSIAAAAPALCTPAAHAVTRPAAHRTATVETDSHRGAAIVAEAARHRGAPYRHGAAGPRAFDCSGYTRFVLRRFGVTLPHSSAEQYRHVRHVRPRDARAGDLVFLRTGGRITHVGIYDGRGGIWHAPKTGDRVKRSTLWTRDYLVGRP